MNLAFKLQPQSQHLGNWKIKSKTILLVLKVKINRSLTSLSGLSPSKQQEWAGWWVVEKLHTGTRIIPKPLYADYYWLYTSNET